MDSATRLALGLAGTTLLVAAVLLWSPSPNSNTELLMDRPADIRAVGDDGCLGRDCNLSSRAAKQDLKHFFHNFLDQNHGGRRPAVTPQTKKVQHTLLHSKEAVNDLTNYYDSLPSGKTARVQSYESRSPKLVRFKDKDAKADLDNFYSSLPGSASKAVLQT
jgi:hypothetical protein